MIRLRLFLERVGLKRILAVSVGVVALVAAGAVFAVVQGRGDDSAQTTSSSVDPGTNLFYLQATAPRVQVRGCSMYIRFTWKPNYHADQYIGAPALILAAGTTIEGMYRKTFKPVRRGLPDLVGEGRLAGRRPARERHDDPGRAAHERRVWLSAVLRSESGLRPADILRAPYDQRNS